MHSQQAAVLYLIGAGPTASANNAIRSGFGAFRIFSRSDAVIIAFVPIGNPFPDVSGHIVQTVTICRKRPHRDGPIGGSVSSLFGGGTGFLTFGGLACSKVIAPRIQLS